MSEIVDRLQPPMNSVVMATWYRTLGFNSIHAGFDEVKEFIKASDNPYGGELNQVHSGSAIEIARWNDINISKTGAEDPIVFDAWVYGRDINTVFTRKRWYDLHLVRNAVERRLGIEPGSIQFIPEDTLDSIPERAENSVLLNSED